MEINRIGLSAHSLNIFIECPRCFYLYIKEGISRPRGPMPSIATGIDSLIKEYFNSFRKKGELPPFLKGKVEGKLILNLKKTYYYDIEENYYLWGHLDEIIQLPNGLYIPVDHKTRGSSLGNNKEPHEAYKFQIGIYSLLLKKENNGKEVDFGYLIYYYPEKALIDFNADQIKNIINFNFDVKQVKIDINKIKEVIKDAIKCLKIDKIPEIGKNCEYCKWIDKTKVYYIESKNWIEKIDTSNQTLVKLNEENKKEEIEFKNGKLF
ncbi:MAG: PD-(D/E)XK nuclease family protein [Candidatus Omnitrophica bacterium]|nr:PD-(D/E)XK nuclease family protein [Candidatus Omnitrophota bacterium]